MWGEFAPLEAAKKGKAVIGSHSPGTAAASDVIITKEAPNYRAE